MLGANPNRLHKYPSMKRLRRRHCKNYENSKVWLDTIKVVLRRRQGSFWKGAYIIKRVGLITK